jgi:hypothetical protein
LKRAFALPGSLLDRPLEARAGFVRAPCPVVEVSEIDEGRDVLRIELKGAPIRPLGFGPGGRIVVQLKAAVEPGLRRLSRFAARPSEGYDARRGDLLAAIPRR